MRAGRACPVEYLTRFRVQTHLVRNLYISDIITTLPRFVPDDSKQFLKPILGSFLGLILGSILTPILAPLLGAFGRAVTAQVSVATDASDLLRNKESFHN